jgi:UTP:GlnB (protein PII) uridylyltransferase
LLYVISQILSDLDIDISLAKVLTEKGAAIDSFYVVLSERGKLVAPEYQQFVADQLRAGISSLDEV